MIVKRITIIGLGLIGGSLGLALKQFRGSELEITGFARRTETAAEAIRRGVVDKAEAQLSRAVTDADIIVIATPVMAERDILQEIAEHLSPDSIVTDTGSTKAQVMKWAEEYLPSTVSFVGGHPMTGKETFGLDEAEARLFQGSVYCLVPSPNTSQEASESMVRFAEWVGAKPIFLDAQRHDELVAGASHLPILLSSALVTTLGESSLWPQMAELAATGYRDSTRLASGSPELNRDICFTNQTAIIDWLNRYIEELWKYRSLVLERDPALEELLRHARDIRQRWLENEGSHLKRQGK